MSIFERWSCNANPAISYYYYLSRSHCPKLTRNKISVQYLGAILAGLFGIISAYLSGGICLDNTLGGFNSQGICVNYSCESAMHFYLSILMIFFITFILSVFLFWILSLKKINHKLKFWLIVFYFAVAISVVFSSGVTTFNPARAFSVDIFHDIYLLFINKLTIYNSELIIYIPFLLAPFLAAFLFYKTSKTFEKYYFKQ